MGCARTVLQLHADLFRCRYHNDSQEAQTRLLADVSMLLQNYEHAYQLYHSLKGDFKADKAWLNYAGAMVRHDSTHGPPHRPMCCICMCSHSDSLPLSTTPGASCGLLLHELAQTAHVLSRRGNNLLPQPCRVRGRPAQHTHTHTHTHTYRLLTFHTHSRVFPSVPATLPSVPCSFTVNC